LGGGLSHDTWKKEKRGKNRDRLKPYGARRVVRSIKNLGRKMRNRIKREMINAGKSVTRENLSVKKEENRRRGGNNLWEEVRQQGRAETEKRFSKKMGRQPSSTIPTPDH